jgi:hypothetical protein
MGGGINQVSARFRVTGASLSPFVICVNLCLSNFEKVMRRREWACALRNTLDDKLFLICNHM